jgi:hypothetical protein
MLFSTIFSAQCTQGAIRLQGGTATQGRVEICNNNVWGTVCDDFWGTPDAQVACRQLGLTGEPLLLHLSSLASPTLYLLFLGGGKGLIALVSTSCACTKIVAR